MCGLSFLGCIPSFSSFRFDGIFFCLSLLVLPFSHTILLILVHVVIKVISMFSLICFYSKRKQMLSKVLENWYNAGAKEVENTFTCV